MPVRDEYAASAVIIPVWPENIMRQYGNCHVLPVPLKFRQYQVSLAKRAVSFEQTFRDYSLYL